MAGGPRDVTACSDSSLEVRSTDSGTWLSNLRGTERGPVISTRSSFRDAPGCWPFIDVFGVKHAPVEPMMRRGEISSLTPQKGLSSRQWAVSKPVFR